MLKRALERRVSDLDHLCNANLTAYSLFHKLAKYLVTQLRSSARQMVSFWCFQLSKIGKPDAAEKFIFALPVDFK